MRSWLVAAAVALSSTACSSLVSTPSFHEIVPDDRLDLPLSRDDVASDLRFAIERIEEVHPDPYAKTPKERIETEIEAILADPASTATRRKLHRRLSCLLALLGDAHTGAGFLQEEWARDVDRGGERLFPLRVGRDKGSIVVVRHVGGDDDTGGPIELQSRVIAIQGRPIEELVADLGRGTAGSAVLRDAIVLENLHVQLWSAGIRPPFRVTLAEPSKPEPTERVLAGQPYAKFFRQDDGRRMPRPADYDASWLDGRVVRLDFRSMDDLPRFEEFCRATFTTMREKHARGLIVDLRENGGGDSQLGDLLLSYVTSTPYRACSRKEWKVSAPYKTFMKSYAHPAIRWLPLQWFDSTTRRYFGADEGSLAVFEQSEPLDPRPNDLRFDGPVVFLIGPQTFSSALMLANAVEDYDLAMLIGEETAESPNAFGEVFPFDLPRSGLNVRVSTARYVRANGDAANPRGVVPDLEVKPTAQDVVVGRDAALERARAWIEEHATEPAPSADAPTGGEGADSDS